MCNISLWLVRCRFTMSQVHKIVEVKPDNDIDKLLIDKFTYPMKDKWLWVGEGKTLLPKRYKTTLIDEIENFDISDDDIFVVSFPRSGNTWTCEMVWMIHNDCDFEAGRRFIHGRFSYMEGSVFTPTELYDRFRKYAKDIDIDYMKNQEKGPRYFKTHLSWYLLPKKVRDGIVKPKIVWVYRNPKDVCISSYHLYKTLNNSNASMDEFIKIFLAGRCYYGSYWDHFYSFWNRRHLPNILCIRYEDMKTKLPTVLQDVSNFLQVPIKHFFMDDLVRHLSFSSMKFNFFCNYQVAVDFIRDVVKKQFEQDGTEYKESTKQNFLRKGAVGAYKVEMSPLMIKTFDDWIAENTKDSGVTFES